MQITKSNTAVRIVLPYAVFAALWIYFSDNILAMLVDDAALLTKIQTYKGLAFIAVTAVMLHLLLRREFARRRHAAEKLQESEAFLRMAQRLARIGTWEQNLDTKQFGASEELCNIFGIRPEEFDGTEQMVWSFIHPDDVSKMEARERDSLAGQELQPVEFRIVRRDGGVRHLWSRRSMLPAQDGLPPRAFGVILDITDRKQADQALRESEARFRAMVESSPIGIFLIAPDGNVIYGNPADLRMIGLSRDEIMGLKWIKAIHPDDREKVMADWRKAMDNGVPYAGTGRYLHEGGTVVWWDVRTAAVHVGEKLVGHVGMVMDITERVKAEEILRRWETIFRHANWGIALVEPQHNRLVSVNPAFARMHGYTVDEINDMDLLATIAPESHALFADATRRIHETGHYVYEITRLRKDGSRFLGLADVTAIRDTDGKFVYRAVNVQDITERHQVQEKLQEYADRLAVLSRQLLAAQETERRHIARELHDEIGQLLTVVKINLQAVEQQPHTKKLAPILKEGIEGVERILSRVRDLSLALRPSVLDDLGLVPALRWYTSKQAQSSGIKVSFDSNGVGRRFAVEIETACYRIAQETLTNVMRHAQATEVMVELGESDGSLEIAVRDNGVGFDAAVVHQRSRRGKTFGLLGMEERAALAGGSLHIDSRPGSGTIVLARIPIAERSENK